MRGITENAWHNLFARNMFIREENGEALSSFEPSFTVLNVASLDAEPERDGTRTSTFILLDLAKRRPARLETLEHALSQQGPYFDGAAFAIVAIGIYFIDPNLDFPVDRATVPLRMLFVGIGLLIASVTPRRGLGVAPPARAGYRRVTRTTAGTGRRCP